LPFLRPSVSDVVYHALKIFAIFSDCGFCGQRLDGLADTRKFFLAWSRKNIPAFGRILAAQLQASPVLC
jgi:hypothetical protein